MHQYIGSHIGCRESPCKQGKWARKPISDSIASAPWFTNARVAKYYNVGMVLITGFLVKRCLAIYRGSWKVTQLRSDPTNGLLVDLSCVDAIVVTTYLEANGKLTFPHRGGGHFVPISRMALPLIRLPGGHFLMPIQWGQFSYCSTARFLVSRSNPRCGD